jgi:chaperone required for assembly of F1-ATPase
LGGAVTVIGKGNGASSLRDRIERPLPKRFYKTVGVTSELGLALDGRPVRTPSKKPLNLPTRPLADAIAAEWLAQSAVVDPSTMPLTKLANTAIDRVLPEQPRIVDVIAAYADSDLVCYRAEEPTELVARQAEAWDPVLAWAQQHLDARFEKITGIMHRAQPPNTLAAFRRHVAGFDYWTLTALHNITTITGSAVISTMLAARDIALDAAWAAAHVDEDWQIARWGEDFEARVRREQRYKEFTKTVEFLGLLRV